MSLIVIPDSIREAKEKETKDATVMDTKSLARHLLLNSYAAGTMGCRLSAHDAFERAEEFMAEQKRRFPKHETADGTEAPNV